MVGGQRRVAGEVARGRVCAGRYAGETWFGGAGALGGVRGAEKLCGQKPHVPGGAVMNELSFNTRFPGVSRVRFN